MTQMPHTDTTVVARSRSQKIIRTILKLPIRILKAITTPTSLYVYILYVSYFFIFSYLQKIWKILHTEMPAVEQLPLLAIVTLI